MKNVYLVSLYVSESIICTKCMPIDLVTKIVEDYVRTYILFLSRHSKFPIQRKYTDVNF